jgi:hypothetical protein
VIKLCGDVENIDNVKRHIIKRAIALDSRPKTLSNYKLSDGTYVSLATARISLRTWRRRSEMMALTRGAGAEPQL